MPDSSTQRGITQAEIEDIRLRSSDVSSRTSSSEAAVTYVSLEVSFRITQALSAGESRTHMFCDLTHNRDKPPPPPVRKQRRPTKAVTTDAITPIPGACRAGRAGSQAGRAGRGGRAGGRVGKTNSADGLKSTLSGYRYGKPAKMPTRKVQKNKGRY